MKTALAIAILLLGLAVGGTVDHQTEVLEQASSVCEYQTEYTTPTKLECINNQLEVNNDR